MSLSKSERPKWFLAYFDVHFSHVKSNLWLNFITQHILVPVTDRVKGYSVFGGYIILGKGFTRCESK